MGKKKFWESSDFAGFLEYLAKHKSLDVWDVIAVVRDPGKWEDEFLIYKKGLPNAHKFYLESGGMAWDKRFYCGLDGHADNCFGPLDEAKLYNITEAHGDNALIFKEEGFYCHIGMYDEFGVFEGYHCWSPGDKLPTS
jgi:hypothetical protein